jgi:phage terminase large subunit
MANRCKLCGVFSLSITILIIMTTISAAQAKRPTVEVHKLPQFDILYNLPEGTNIVVAIGGRGGAKTYEVSKFIAYSSTIKKKRCVVLRDEKELIRESILNEIWERYDTANINGALDAHYSKNDTELKDKATGKTLIYTKGFRASNNQKKANLKGPSDIDIAVVEEAEDIRDVDKFNTFVDGLRKEGCLIIVILNTPDINHWLVKRYFNLTQVEDGYFEISPKVIPGFVCILTDFTKNPFLPQHIINNYNAYGDPNSHLYNKYYYMTAIKGYASTGRKGQILTKVKPIKLAEYMALPFKEFYGQDFGTASPAGMVGVKFDKNNCYARQINYLPMNTLEIAKLYCTLGFTPNDKIIADSADKDACEKLRSGYQAKELSTELLMNYPGLVRGFNVHKCVKGTGSVENGISIMDGLVLHAVEESTDLWFEIMNWCYDQDKNGNYTNDPMAGYDHLIDSWRYVVTDQRGKKAMYGI